MIFMTYTMRLILVFAGEMVRVGLDRGSVPLACLSPELLTHISILALLCLRWQACNFVINDLSFKSNCVVAY